jgi:hypothetical protein
MMRDTSNVRIAKAKYEKKELIVAGLKNGLFLTTPYLAFFLNITYIYLAQVNFTEINVKGFTLETERMSLDGHEPSTEPKQRTTKGLF